MLDALRPLPADPILGLSVAYRADTNPNKVDLGPGVYKDANGTTPVLRCIKTAEARRNETEESKAYLPPVGVAEFNSEITKLMLGADHKSMTENRVISVMAPGGCGSLRIGAEMINKARPGATIWVSNPTWANHIPLMGNAGLKIKEYRYYNKATASVEFDAMMEDLSGAQADDIVLVHGCCHNPCGADLSLEQWQALTDLCNDKGVLPFVDVAYHGLGQGLEEDAAGWRLMASQMTEMVMSYSCSKNFGLYRDRIGAVVVIGKSAEAAAAAQTHLLSIARGSYSMPPAHGGFLVANVLGDPALRAQWEEELAEMRDRINAMRDLLATELNKRCERDFSFIRTESGMFSFLGISPEQVDRLRDEYSIYMVGSSRINVAGVSDDNIEYLANAIAAVL